MAYSVQDYVNANLSVQDLERRIKAIEPLVRVYIRDYNDIKGAMENHEFGMTRLRELKEKLDDYKQEMENIALVIELMVSGDLYE